MWPLNVLWPPQVRVPDIHPGQRVGGAGLMSMCAGEFTEVYSQPQHAGTFDCVVTCFFIDTAHNVLDYMEVIHDVLKVSGF